MNSRSAVLLGNVISRDYFAELQFDVSRESSSVFETRIYTLLLVRSIPTAELGFNFPALKSLSIKNTMDRTLDEIVSERNVSHNLSFSSASCQMYL